MKEISAKQTLRSALKNKYRLWRPSQKFPSETAAARISDANFCFVNHEPKFTISPEDKIFTMGSCFARNVENVLMNKKYQVTTGDFSLEHKYYNNPSDGDSTNVRAHRGVLNKYNVHSMLSELERVENCGVSFEDLFIKVSDELFFDPQASNTPAGSLDDVLYVRSEIDQATSTVKDANVVFLTLGLTETWFDKLTGLSLNTPPSPQFMKSLDDRLVFKNASFFEVHKLLGRIIDLLNGMKTTKKILITVSPVPMGTTFSGKDVIVANTYSKSTLRSAAQHIAEEYENVDYFPTYEMALHTSRGVAFKEDMAHVQNSMVKYLMTVFEDCYLAK